MCIYIYIHMHIHIHRKNIYIYIYIIHGSCMDCSYHILGVAEAAKRRLEEMKKTSPASASSGLTPDPKALKTNAPEKPSERGRSREASAPRPNNLARQLSAVAENSKAAAQAGPSRKVYKPHALHKPELET